ncbi:MAG: bifunctional oligoribonuclease/PAP phosphatase NrnA [Spirochaetaceae bacterium]|nr:MAG: bifunctional oligoribonuclease/PAP phosphatase NrnA [Spirochaetaceae bacterium]
MNASFCPPDGVIEFLEGYQKFLVFGHVEPDADCVASQLVLSSFFRRRGKEVMIFSEGPFDRPEIIAYEQRFRKRIEDSNLKGDPAALILDCSTADRIGSMEKRIQGLPVLVVDHHAAGEDFGDVRWVDPRAPSVTFLIQHLIEAYLDRPTPGEAGLLLFGLARDTGFFRHLVENSGFVFEAVSRLVDIGASPRETYRMIHSGWELAKAKLLALSLQRVESELKGKVLITYQSLEDLHSLGSKAARGSDEVYRILQAVRGVEVVAFIQEEERDRCSVGLRSNGEYDVGTLARSMGGGGHTLAAGYTVAGSVPVVHSQLLAALKHLVKS